MNLSKQGLVCQLLKEGIQKATQLTELEGWERWCGKQRTETKQSLVWFGCHESGRQWIIGRSFGNC